MTNPESVIQLPLASTGCACCVTSEVEAKDEATVSPSGVSTRVEVTGMTCNHCVASVTEELSQIEGVTAVDVDLKAGGTSVVLISSASDLPVGSVEAAIDEAGYALVTSAP